MLVVIISTARFPAASDVGYQGKLAGDSFVRRAMCRRCARRTLSDYFRPLGVHAAHLAKTFPTLTQFKSSVRKRGFLELRMPHRGKFNLPYVGTETEVWLRRSPGHAPSSQAFYIRAMLPPASAEAAVILEDERRSMK